MQIIGFQLTAYIGRTNVWEVREWLKNSLPRHLEERMQATYDVAKPIEEVEFDLVAQYFLINKTDGIEPYKYPARMLRDAVDIPAARAVLMELVRKEFLINVADHLAAFVGTMMVRDILPTIKAPRGLDLNEYIQAILKRFQELLNREPELKAEYDKAKKR